MATTTVAVVLTAAPAQAQSGNVRRFDIAAQPLPDAIILFGRQAGIEVSAQSATTRGRITQGVSGILAPAEALSRLLSGTGLTFRWISARSVMIETAPEVTDGAVTLGPVRIEGANGDGSTSASASITSDPAATEGTRSYAAAAVTVGKGDVKSLREVPQTVTVVTRQQIEDQNLTTLNDALIQTPGVTIQPSVWGYQYYYARGYSLATSYDGVSVSYFTNLDDLASVDRVEVLRGPAALIRGSGGTGDFGGVVNLIKKRPQKDFGVGGSVGVGSWRNLTGDIDVTGSLDASGKIRARAVLAGEDRDFFYDKTHRSKWTAFGTIEADLTPTTMVTLAATYQESHTDAPFTGIPAYSDGTLVSTRRSTNVNPSWAYDNSTLRNLSAELVQDLGSEWKATGKLLYRSVDHVYHNYYGWYTGVQPDGTSTFRGMYYPEDNSSLGIDVNVSGPFQLFGGSHKLTLGVELNRYKSKFTYLATLVTGHDALNPNIAESEVPTTSDAAGSADKGEILIPQKAAYGVLSIKPFEALTLVAGARVTNYKYKTHSAITGVSATTYDYSGRVTPYAAVLLDVTREISLYGSYTDVFVPQTVWAYPNTLLPPRIGWQGEFGIKGSFLEGRLNASLAIYRLRDSNRPIRDEEHVGCGGTAAGYCYLAAGLVQSQGVDAEISGSPTPGLELTMGYSYNKNEYVRDTSNTEGTAFLSYSPRHSLKLWATYDFGAQSQTGPLAKLRLGGGIIAQSKVDFSSLVSQGAYAIVSGQIGYQATAKTLVTFSVNNLLDRKYLSTSGYYGEPRNVRLVVRKSF